MTGIIECLTHGADLAVHHSAQAKDVAAGLGEGDAHLLIDGEGFSAEEVEFDWLEEDVSPVIRARLGGGAGAVDHFVEGVLGLS